MSNPYATKAYKNNQNVAVLTADPLKLVIMIYEGAIKHLRIAKKAIEENNIIQRNKSIYKAQDFINELISSLDFEKGGDISKNLYSLYEYCIWRSNMAIVKNSAEMVEEVITRLETLLSAWKEIYQKQRK